ncbi:M10 family metallopeptidase [Sphingomonas sp.]|uniref:M10 family metallopeptidase n=1 Tax=Sphingomonas sp. TaxID=28214 RepID=UPI003B00C3EA
MSIDLTAMANAKFDDANLACGCPLCMGKSVIARSHVAATDESIRHTVDTTIQAAPISQGVTPTHLTGTLTAGEEYDLFGLSVVAGQTYSVALRGVGANGIDDPLLSLFDSNFGLLNFDDDGGRGITSLLTFTAATSGTFYLTAQAFGAGDVGDYALDVWVKPAADAVPETFAAAPTIGLGTTFGHIDTSNDVDTYKVYLEAGKLYTFELAAGADYATTSTAVPTGEVDTVLALYAPNGSLITFNDDITYPRDISSGLSFVPETSGFYYVDAFGYPDQTGGYTLDINQIDPSQFDPLDAINWVNASNIPTETIAGAEYAYVYFGDSDENFNQTGDDGQPMVTIDWNNFEKQQVMLALEEYSRILGITYVITDDSSKATFRLLKTESEQYGAYFYPQDPAYGAEQGVGVFNVLSGGWNQLSQVSLLKGGYSFAVLLHEFGHAHGLAHPHDNGGGSDIMLGVTGATGSLGLYDLNQGVYTVMSYNDAWQLHPDGPTPYTRTNIDSGWSGTLGAFDIAELQDRYGVVDRNTGNNVYFLGDANDFGTYYQTIWDSAGTDEIRYTGSRDAQIDLTAATLDYSPTGGGVVSFVDNIWGGYTIANGVVIENATGGSGNDILIGNAAANILTGGAGNDTLQGGLGNDTLNGGDGIDLASYADATAGVTVRLDSAGKKTTVMGTDTFISIEGVIGSKFNDTLYGDGGSNVLEGRAGEDVIRGGAGNDTIIGGAGRDAMAGGAGADRFVFLSIDDFAPVVTGFAYGDKIEDFSSAEGDKIDLSAISNDPFVFLGTGRFHATGEAEVRYVRGTNSTLVQIDANGDGIVDGVLQLKAMPLSANDFVL